MKLKVRMTLIKNVLMLGGGNEKVQVFTVIKGSLGNAYRTHKAPLDICRILEAAGDAESFLLSCDQDGLSNIS